MNQTEAKLDFHHPIDQSDHDTSGLRGDEETENLVEISPYCGSAEHGESPPGSPETADQSLLFSTSGVGVLAPEPVYEEILSEKVATNPTVDFETMIAADDTAGAAMAEIRNTGDVAAIDAVDSTPVKRKRGRPRKNPELKATPPVRKKEREDVCFVCFDRTNPNLVACNKRGCYKAYHPACVNRDESFFGSKAKWNCGWHICSSCQKIARYMCYTCTTSYCKDCIIDESKFVCVRGTHGFCQSCHNTVTLIEQNKLAFEKKDGIDFDDTDSFTYLFKAYWLDQKGKLSLLSEDLNNARHPYSVVDDDESSDELYDVNKDRGSSSESSLDHKSNISLKKKVRNRLPVAATDKNPPGKEVDSSGTLLLQETGWASVELLDLVAHMRNGDQSFISQFDVQALLLDYIKKYNLRDPRRKSQIICDLRLQSLFGKERVGHFEMLKLLESHFYSKEAPQIVVDINQAESLLSDNKLADDTEDGDTFARAVSDKKRKNRKRTDDVELQANIDDYAAIDVHNISHVFLRRSLVEDLLDDIETFNDKVIGSFVRIRISNAGQRQDLYRLVQIIGTQESSKPYKVGKKTTGIVLEILNLNKKETSTIDSISNQDFTEEECQRLRQSIKCGLIDRLKVGYIQEKAKVLHAVRVSDSIETEKLRLSHLRDRASETGRRKELRECVEKLQLLNNPEERRRRLDEVPQIHADPKMDPDYESPEESQDDKTQDFQLKSKESLSQRKRRELIPRGRAGTIGNNWNGMHKSPNLNRESSRRMHGEAWLDRSNVHNNMAERPNEALQNHQSEAASLTELQAPKSLELKPHGPAPEVSLAPPEGSIPNETDKFWHYRDPSMIIQGPFSLSQLRKWNATGYFPPDLRVWKAPEKQEDSVLLADMLAQKSFNNTVMLATHQDSGNWNENLNIKQSTFNDLPSPPPVWRTSPIAAPNSSEVRSGTYSSVWSSPIFGNPYHTPIYRETGNIWSPTRPDIGMPSSTPKVENPPSGLNGGINNYETYESECPSPTPRSESTESFLQPPVGIMATNHGPVAVPLRAHDPSLASHSAQSVIVNPGSSNPVSSAGLAEFQSNISPISAAVDVTGGYKHAQKPEFSPIQKLETEFLATDRSQNPIPNFLPMEPSLPSPTPKSSFSNDAMLMMQNANAPTYGNPNANSDWGTLVTNTSWGIPVQANASNATPIYGTLSQANANNTGWGAVPQGLFVEAAKDAGRRFDYEGRSGDGYPRHRDQDTGRRSGSEHWNGRPQSGGWGGSSWPHQTLSGGGDGQRKVCRFHERGHCRKGASCKYLHIDHRRNV